MTSIRHLNGAGRLAFGSAVGALLWSAAQAPTARVEAQSPATPLSYTVAQADQGQTAYVEHCASCHGQNLDDGAYGPPLKGNDFRQKWGARSAEPLFTFTSTKMPPARPGTLGDASYAQLLAYMLQENGAPSGTRELPADPEALEGDGGARLAPRRRRRARAPGERAAGSAAAESPGQDPSGHRRHADPARGRRLAAVAAHLRSLRVQPAEEDQQDQRQRAACGVDVVAAQRSERVNADRSRRRAVRSQLRRQGSGARCRHRRPALAVLAPAAGRCVPQRQAGHLDLRHAPLRADLGRAHRRARREDREGGLGPGGGRSRERLPDDRRPPGCAREGDGRDHRPRRGRQLHRRARRGDGQGSLAVLHHRAARTSPAATAGTGCRSRSETAARSGFPGATIPSTTSHSSRRATPTTPARSGSWSTSRA